MAGRKEYRRYTRIALVGVALACGAGSVASFVSFRSDGAVLRRAAQEVTTGMADDAARVLRLLDFVWRRGGTARNEEYFLFRGQRATPRQVMAGGGDCADKSRLLCALLREIGIGASPALCFDAQSGAAAHTIVEARLSDGSFMAVDPAFNLYFPREVGGGYYGLLDLRRDRGIVDRRVAALAARGEGGRGGEVYYLRSSADYGTARTMNWERNVVTRAVFPFLKLIWGDEAYRLPRPVLLEEPQWSAALLALAGALAAGLAAWRVPSAIRQRDTAPRAACQSPAPAATAA